MTTPPNIYNGFNLSPSRNLTVNLPYLWDPVSGYWAPEQNSVLTFDSISQRAQKTIHKFGNNPTVSNQVSDESPETIWDGSSDYVFPSDLGDSIQINSSEDTDNQEFVVEGLDENFKEQSWTGNLNGTGEVDLSGSWSRIHRAYNNGFSYLSGDVNIHKSGDANLSYAQVKKGKNQTLMAIYTVPSGYKGYMTQYHISAQNPSSSSDISYTVEIKTREFGKIFRTKEISSVSTKAFAHQEFPFPEELPPKTDIVMNIISSNGNNGSINGDFDMALIL